jgi:hypothetical protein
VEHSVVAIHNPATPALFVHRTGVQHWISAGPGQYPALEFPPSLLQAKVDIQIPKLPVPSVHVGTAEPVGFGAALAVVGLFTAVPALAVEADDSEAACAWPVGPKPKQADARGNVVDYKAIRTSIR